MTCDRWEEVTLLLKFQLPSTYGSQSFLIIILCCWLSCCFLQWKFSQKKLSFINASFTTKPSTIMIDESSYRSEISRATIFTKWAFQVFHWKVEKYWVLVRQKNYFTCNSLKRDRVALVGLPPAALGPEEQRGQSVVFARCCAARAQWRWGLPSFVAAIGPEESMANNFWRLHYIFLKTS